jgi:hypothetical protein
MKEIMEEMENVEKKGGRESRVKAWLNWEKSRKPIGDTMWVNPLCLHPILAWVLRNIHTPPHIWLSSTIWALYLLVVSRIFYIVLSSGWDCPCSFMSGHLCLWVFLGSLFCTLKGLLKNTWYLLDLAFNHLFILSWSVCVALLSVF